MADGSFTSDPRLGPAATAFLASLPQGQFIGGDWAASQGDESITPVDPSTGRAIVEVAAGGAADIDAAVAAARKAFEQPSWRGMSPHARTNLLLRIADRIEANVEELAQLESLNNGTPLAITRAVIGDIPQTFRYYAGWPTKIYGETNPSAEGVFNYTLREPVGVCGQIIPWNGPLASAAWKIAPALACGNTVVLKPAEQTPITALRFAQLMQELDLPPGVINIVNGYGESAGAALAGHLDVDKIAFTGSTEVGRKIVAASAGNLKRVTVELGGKSPNIVFPDADLDAAAAATVAGFCFMTGQICVASSRVFVHADIYDAFAEKLVAAAGTFNVGDPFDAGTTMGPVVSKEQFERVTAYFDVGRQGGASVLLGAERHQGPGYYVKPTIFGDVDNDGRLAQEEIFGPVASMIRFTDEADAIAKANRTDFGLAAAVWTRDLSRAHRMSRALRAGTVWINTYLMVDQISPFGGYKHSGYGRELGRQSIDAYTEVKSVYAKLG